MNGLQNLMVRIGDLLLAGFLDWPRDAALIVLALLTAGLMLFARWVVETPQQRQVVAADQRTLKTLLRSAKQRADAAAMQRHRHVQLLVTLRRLRIELVPLLIGGMLASAIVLWGNRRLDSYPLAPTTPFGFQLQRPVSAFGQTAHVVPAQGLSAEGGWVQNIDARSATDGTSGIAKWTFSAGKEVRQIVVRAGDDSWTHHISVGSGRYEAPRIRHSREVTTSVGLHSYHPFGVIPGIALIGLRPWAFGLFLLSAAFYFSGQWFFQRQTTNSS